MTTRPYHSPLRQRRAEQTRQRIVEAGAAIAHELAGWDWRGLTYARVAERAGVSKRTVYRYFPNEQSLRDAVMQSLHEEAGVSLGELTLDGFADLTARVFAYLSTFPASAGSDDPTMDATDQARSRALLAAVEASTRGWTPDEQRLVAAALDTLWGLPTYERFVSRWALEPEAAAAAAGWVVALIVEAIERGDRPPST